jgi:hypothetical protein
MRWVTVLGFTAFATACSGAPQSSDHATQQDEALGGAWVLFASVDNITDTAAKIVFETSAPVPAMVTISPDLSAPTPAMVSAVDPVSSQVHALTVQNLSGERTYRYDIWLNQGFGFSWAYTGKFTTAASKNPGPADLRVTLVSKSVPTVQGANGPGSGLVVTYKIENVGASSSAPLLYDWSWTRVEGQVGQTTDGLVALQPLAPSASVTNTVTCPTTSGWKCTWFDVELPSDGTPADDTLTVTP